MIAESSPQGYDISEDDVIDRRSVGGADGPVGANSVVKTSQEVWDEWYQPYFDYIYANDEIRAVAYINANWDAENLWNAPYENGYWGDARIEENTLITTNWKAEMAKSTWIHGSSNLADNLGNSY